MTIVMMLAALTSPQVQDGGTLEPLSPNAAVALFKRVCVEPFPDPARFAQGIAASDLGMRKTPETPEQAMQPGDSWFSSTAQVGYAAADWMPRDLPSPQCMLTARLSEVPDHAAIAAAAATTLGLPPGKTSGKGRVQTQWDVTGPSGRFRYFLTTMPALAGSYQLRFTILNLRNKK